MMRLYRFLFHTGYWLVALTLCGGVWWLVDEWREPKPAWSVPTEDKLKLTHYQPAKQLLTGYRLDAGGQMEVVVVDAPTGHIQARLTVPHQTIPPLGSQPSVDIGPRLYGDTVVHFTDSILETGEHEVQFRSWKYASEAKETILATWRTSTEYMKYSAPVNQEWLKTAWSIHEAGLVLVYRYLPTDQIMNHLLSAFNPDLNLGYIVNTRHRQLSVWLCEVWQWDQAIKQFKKTTQYSAPTYERVDSPTAATWPRYPLPNRWATDGRHFTISGWGPKKPVNKQIDSLTGESKSYEPFEEVGYGYGVQLTGKLMLLQRIQAIEVRVSPKTQVLYSSPTRKKSNNWGINDWRPILDAETLKKVLWPDLLDQSIVGGDHFVTDALDPSLYLYHSNVDDDSPYWEFKPPGTMNHHFVFMRYQEGKLKIEHQWRYDQDGGWTKSVLCGQLFVEGQQAIGLSDTVAKLLARVPYVWQFYLEKAKINAPYVAEVAVVNGTMGWKKLEREFSLIPLLGKDYLLLQCRTAQMQPNTGGYECWKLPMKYSSPWWVV